MRVHFTNLGCKLNQAEVERLARQFAAAGHRVVDDLADADLHVVNSCTVTSLAARSSRKAASRGRRDPMKPGLRTVLTGCYASEPGGVPALPDVDLLVPNHDKERLLDLVHAAFPDTEPSSAVELATGFVPASALGTRALLKVEDGCNMRCAFCIIPATRGRQHSRPLPELVADLQDLWTAGHREVVVTGVQISAYRDGGSRLVELVRALLSTLDAVDEPRRLRLTSIAPWDMQTRLLDLWEDPRLCRHLHLSLQSGSTATLRRMRRPYSAEAYDRLLDRIRTAVPGVALTTDVIVGFPGETAAEFEESLDFVAAAGFAKVHVFPFSSRPGTEAADLPEPVEAQEKKARMARMLAVAERSEREFWRRGLGSREIVLWERPKGELGQGLTDNYIRVWSAGGAALRNRFSEVDLVDLTDAGVAGEIVSTR